jgi:uncharacterized membrane protein YedE/YeeE
MDQFTPVPALAGGILLGLASVWLFAANGRIAGVSGILYGLVAPGGSDRGWRASFIAGLFAAGCVWHAIAGDTAAAAHTGLALPALAGLLIGFGARLGSGCTSGHGVCGLGRRSVRSAVAVGVFMSSAFATTFVVRHLIGGAS